MDNKPIEALIDRETGRYLNRDLNRYEYWVKESGEMRMIAWLDAAYSIATVKEYDGFVWSQYLDGKL